MIMMMKSTYGADEGLVLLLLAISLAVEVDVDGVHDGQVVEFKVFAPEAQFVLLFAGRASVQGLVQTQLAEIPAKHSKISENE